MKTQLMKFALVGALALGAASAFGQSRVVIDQSTNAVAFSNDNRSWGLEVGGNEIIEPGYKTVDFQSGLFKLEDWDNNWMVIDKDGNNQVPDWVKASDVKISEGFVLFEKANGGVEALIYDRSTWTVVKAQATTYDAMHDEIVEANRHKGTSIHGYESLAETYDRIYRTRPRYVPAESAGGKAFIKRGEKEIANWTGTGEWINPHVNHFGGPGREYPYLGEDPYREDHKENYFLVHQTAPDTPGDYLIWISPDKDEYSIMISREKGGYVKITPHPEFPTRLVMCQTADGVEHPVWVWGQPLINAVVPNASWADGEATKKREEIAKPHVNCPHCIEQSKLYNER